MPNFSKFLPAGEELLLVIYPRQRAWTLYFWLLLILANFFILYPLWHYGRPGVSLWCLLLFVLLLATGNQLLKMNSYYLLSSTSLWHVFYVNAYQIRTRGVIPIDEIKALELINEDDILLKTSEHNFWLYNVRDRRKVFEQLKNIILPKVDKSGII